MNCDHIGHGPGAGDFDGFGVCFQGKLRGTAAIEVERVFTVQAIALRPDFCPLFEQKRAIGNRDDNFAVFLDADSGAPRGLRFEARCFSVDD